MTWALTIPHRGQTTVATRFAMSPLLIYLDEGPGPEDSGTFPPSATARPGTAAVGREEIGTRNEQ